MTKSEDRTDMDDLLAEAGFARRLALALTGNPADAEDVVQEALAAGAEHLPRVRTTWRGWLAGTVRNLVRLKRRTEGRRARREHAAARPEGLPSAADAAARAEMLEHVSRALQALGEPYRSALVHRYYDGLPPREIAARGGVPVTTVKTWLRRGLARLRSDLDREPGGRAHWVLLLLPRAEWAGRRPGAATAAGATLLDLLASKAALLVGAAVALAGFLALPSLVDSPGPPSAPPPGPDRPADDVETATRGEDGPRPEATVAAAARSDPPPPVDLVAADLDRDLFGRVVDASGRPVAGARLVAVERPWKRCRILTDRSAARTLATTVSSSDGSFLLSLARGRIVELRADAGAFAETILPDLPAGARVEVVLHPGAEAVVEVANATGGPAPETRLLLWRPADGVHPVVLRRGVTDASGRCRFEGLTPGPVLVEASHPCLADPGPVPGRVPEGGRLDLRIGLERGETFSGRVLDEETGRPIPGAVVGEGWNRRRGVRTDESGAFVLRGGSRERGLTAAAAGYGAREVTIPAATDAPLEIRLRRADEVTGRVTDGRGAPVAGARVTAMGTLHRNGVQCLDAKSAETGPDGRFVLEDLRRDLAHTLIVLSDGRGRRCFEFDPRADGPGRIDLGDLVLPGPRTIEGRVVDGDGTPQPGVLVDLRDPGVRNLGSHYGSESRRTDDRGRFRFPELGPGHFVLRVTIAGSTLVETEVDLPEERKRVEAVLEAPNGGNLVVRVTDEEGRPVSGATVAANATATSSPPTSTGEDGRVRLVGLPLRALGITVRPAAPPGDAGPRFLPKTVADVVPDGREIEVVLEEAAEIRGRVLAPDGEPARCLVLSALAEGKRIGRARTGPDGEFSLLVRRGVPCRLRIDGRSRPMGFAGPVVLRPIEGEVRDIEAPARDVVIRTRELPRDRSLAVRVVDRRGRPVEGALVAIPPDDDHPMSSRGGPTGRTDADGVAAFSGLTPQARRITVSRGDAVGLAADAAVPARERVVPANQTVEVSFRPGVLFTGTVRDDEGRPVAGAEVDLFRVRGERLDATSADDAGRFRLVGIPGERHEIFAGYRTESGVVRRTLLSDLGDGASDLTLVPE